MHCTLTFLDPEADNAAQKLLAEAHTQFVAAHQHLQECEKMTEIDLDAQMAAETKRWRIKAGRRQNIS